MQAVVIDKPGDVDVGEVADPSPGPDEVVVAVRACGICGTDIHLADGEFSLARYPLVPGHEFAGEVVALGRDVSSLRLGAESPLTPTITVAAAGPAGRATATCATTSGPWA